eukprot:363925-Chlamydomonas_euryale.AAC.3
MLLPVLLDPRRRRGLLLPVLLDPRRRRGSSSGLRCALPRLLTPCGRAGVGRPAVRTWLGAPAAALAAALRCRDAGGRRC